jgi:hypothetical protein
MPLEFALRPRFRLDERVATPRRRELPPLVLPVAAYWLGTAALTYKLVYAAPAEAAPEPRAAPTTEIARQPLSPAPHATAEPHATAAQYATPAPHAPSAPPLSSHAWNSVPSLDDDAREPVQARPTLAPAREATRIASPRKPLSPRPNAGERELAFVPPARNAEPPRREPAPEPHRWLFDAPPAATTGREPSATSAAREPRNEVHDTGGALPTCEMVAAGENQEIDLRSSRQAPDLAREALAGVLEHGAYLTACDVPDRTTLDICVAVQEGKVKGVTVVTRPADRGLAACVRRAVARLRFPYGSRLDITRTRFDAAR